MNPSEIRNLIVGETVKPLAEVKDADGNILHKGDIVGFKAGMEQTGKIVKITGKQITIQALSDEGFDGGYVAGQKYADEMADRVWLEEAREVQQFKSQGFLTFKTENRLKKEDIDELEDELRVMTKMPRGRPVGGGIYHVTEVKSIGNGFTVSFKSTLPPDDKVLDEIENDLIGGGGFGGLIFDFAGTSTAPEGFDRRAYGADVNDEGGLRPLVRTGADISSSSVSEARQGWDYQLDKNRVPGTDEVVLFNAEYGRHVIFDKNEYVWQGDPKEKNGKYEPAVKKIRAKDVNSDESVYDNPSDAMSDVKAWIQSESIEESVAMDMAIQAQQDTEDEAGKQIAAAFKKTAKLYTDLLSGMTGKKWKASKVSPDIFSLDGPGPKDKIDIYWEADIMTGAEDPEQTQFTITVEGPLGTSPRSFRKQTPADITKKARDKSMEYLWWLADALQEWAEEIVKSIVEYIEVEGKPVSESFADSLRDIINERKGSTYARGSASKEADTWNWEKHKVVGGPAASKSRKKAAGKSERQASKKEIDASLRGESIADMAGFLDYISESYPESGSLQEGSTGEEKIHAALVSLVSMADGLAKVSNEFYKYVQDALKKKKVDVGLLADYGRSIEAAHKDLRDAYVMLGKSVHEDITEGRIEERQFSPQQTVALVVGALGYGLDIPALRSPMKTIALSPDGKVANKSYVLDNGFKLDAEADDDEFRWKLLKGTTVIDKGKNPLGGNIDKVTKPIRDAMQKAGLVEWGEHGYKPSGSWAREFDAAQASAQARAMQHAGLAAAMPSGSTKATTLARAKTPEKKKEKGPSVLGMVGGKLKKGWKMVFGVPREIGSPAYAAAESVTPEDIRRLIDERTSSEPTEMVCNECGKKFKKKIGPSTFEVKCPKCKSYDTEPEPMSYYSKRSESLDERSRAYSHQSPEDAKEDEAWEGNDEDGKYSYAVLQKKNPDGTWVARSYDSGRILKKFTPTKQPKYGMESIGEAVLARGEVSEKDAWEALVDGFLPTDLKMNRENHYVPAKGVLFTREMHRQHEIARSIGSKVRSDFWHESTGDSKAQYGFRGKMDNEAYSAAIEDIASALKGAGFSVKVDPASKEWPRKSGYIIYNKKVGDAISRRYDEYLDLLKQHGAIVKES